MEKLLITEIWTTADTIHGCIVFLKPKNANAIVPIIMGRHEMQSIIIGREKLKTARPLTHDLLLNILDSLRITLRQIEIHRLIDDTFHARIILDKRHITGGKSVKVIDSRPSDAIALAARKKCPIFITKELLEKAGIPLEYFIEELEKEASLQGKNEKSEKPEKYQNLLRQLNKAVEAEEYERAAQIRDILIEMENE